MKSEWQSGIVPQKMVSEFTGGLLKPQSLVNLCSKGQGPMGKIYIRGRACWPVDTFLEWLLENVTGNYEGFEIKEYAPNNNQGV